MELKHGYKCSEVGAIPQEWEISRLGDIVTAGPKNGYSGRGGTEARGTLTLRLTATSSGSLILNDETVKRLNETIDPQSDLFLQGGDVLIQRSNTPELVGTAVVFDGPSAVYTYPDLIMRLRFKDQSTAHWIWRYANSLNGRRFFLSIAAGSTGSMPKISGAKLRTMPIPLPPLPERRAITEVLSDADALVGALVQLIDKKRHLKQAALQQLLTGQTRLSEFDGTKRRYKATEMGQIPEEWGVTRIRDAALITTGKRNTQDRIEDGQYPFFVRSQTVERINTYSFDGEAVLTAGDGVGTGRVFHYINGKADFHQRVYRVSDFSSGLNGYYFFLYFSTHFYGRIMAMTAKSSVDSVRLETIAGMPIPLPSPEEQSAIATVVSDMEAEIAALEQRLDKTRALKVGMIQELLTGRTRLL